MPSFSRAERVFVSLWGHRVGTIVPAPRQGLYAFRYDPAFVASGIEISPLSMPLRREPYAFPELPQEDFGGLPPVFADSLPDSFGTGLVDLMLSERGLSRREITPLDRLAYIGKRGMGALCYEPDRGPRAVPSALEMRTLAESAKRAASGELAGMSGDDALRAIIRLGSSAGGAQAKAVVGWNRVDGRFVFGDGELPAGFEHWIVKFTPKEFPWRGDAEFETNRAAAAAGVATAESRIVEIDGLRHFMSRRFDREGTRRHHLLSFAALAHLPPGAPPRLRSYEQLFAAADALGLPWEDREEIFRRMAFNVLAGECDDHAKNVSFLLREGGAWRLAPAYDLTGSRFPSSDPWSAHGGVHQLSVGGKFSGIGEDDLLRVADRFGIGTASSVLARVRAAVSQLPPAPPGR
ncbi:MAG: type II toxin-antitoxin system HipA family toxin [Kiritimatiellae bacterium]|nr:type II toxin-antitoxin system HipA family toxin [Kiritimatiellia bacterium]